MPLPAAFIGTEETRGAQFWPSTGTAILDAERDQKSRRVRAKWLYAILRGKE